MRVINSKHKSEVQVFAENVAVDIEKYLTENSDKYAITFEKIKQDFASVPDPKTGRVPMEDGTIAAIFQHLGYQVQE